MEVYNNQPKPQVKIMWDPAPDIEGSKEGEERDQILLPSLWNKNVDGAWRMDVDIFVEDSDGLCEDEESDDSSSLGTFVSDNDDTEI